MLILVLKGILLVTMLYLFYIRGYMACFLGEDEELYKYLKEWYLKRYGEEYLEDD